MKKDIEIKISRITRSVDLSTKSIGNDGENLQGNLVISFVDEFVNGQARLEYRIDNDEKRYIILKKENQSYVTPISNVITKTGIVNMQLVVTEGVDEDAIPVFKSDIFPLYVGGSINAELIAPDGYDEWIDVANTKLNTIDEAVEEAVEQSAYAKEQGDYAKSVGNKVDTMLENGELHGATFLPNVDNEGNLSWSNDKNLENPATQNIRGPQGVMGPQGEAFKIKKTYSSKTEMVNDFYNMEFGDYVMITSNIEVEDNAKLYSRGEYEWVFITDFSGSTGIQGPQGVQGIQGIQGERGEKGDKPVKGVDYFTQSDIDSMVDTITEDANSEFNRNVDAKTEEYNQNAEEKVEEFNSNIDDIIAQSEDAYNNQIFGLGEGESIHLRDSANARLRVLNIDGNFKQETTTGRNKLPFLKETTLTQNGLTFASDGKGAYKITGTPTATTSFEFDIEEVIIPENYYIHLRNDGTLSYNYALSFRNANSNIKAPGFGSKNNILALSTEEVTINKIVFICNEVAIGTEVSITLNPSIESSDAETDYELYTGGQASPSPNYPQEIEVVEAYNLFDKNNANILNAYINGSTNKIEASETGKSLFIKCKQNTEYTITRKNGARFVACTMKNIPVVGVDFTNIVSNNESALLTIKSGAEDNYLAVYYYNGSVDTISEQEILDSLQIIEKKDVKSYAPYGYIKCASVNKNLFDLSKWANVKLQHSDGILTISNDSITIENPTGIDLYTQSGMASKNVYLDDNQKIYLIEVDPNTDYTISFDVNGTASNSASSNSSYYSFYDKNFKSINQGSFGAFVVPTIKHSKKITTTADTRFLGIRFGTEAIAGITRIYSKIQIDGPIATDFELHEENELLINLQNNFFGKLNENIKDNLKISFNSEDGFYHAILNKKVEKIILDGNINTKQFNILQNTSNENYYYLYTTILDKVAVGGLTDNICSHFKCVKNMLLDTNDVNVFAITNSESNKLRFMIHKNLINDMTVESIQNFLAENPVTVYYVLAEPYEVDLGVVDMPKTYENISNITLISNIDTNMQVEYVKHTKTVIDNLQSQIDAINTLLSTTATSAMLLDNYEKDLESEVME